MLALVLLAVMTCDVAPPPTLDRNVPTAANLVVAAKPAPAWNTEGLEGLDDSQKAQILALLARRSFPHAHLIGKAWPRGDKTYVVAGLEDSNPEVSPRLHVVVFTLSSPSVRVLARGEQPFDFGRKDTLGGFDFAPFRLTTRDYAFGVRYARTRWYAGGGEASLEGIILFRLHGERVEEILRTPTSYEADLAGDWNEDGTRDRKGASGRAVIVVGTKKTLGYFDWKMKVEGGRSAPLVWDGSRYVLNGGDPFGEETLEVFEAW